MKNLLLITFLIFLTGPSFSQNTKWSTVVSRYSSGPIAPEYQYTYDIMINSDGSGILTNKNGTGTNEYNFSVSKKGRSKLNNALKKSKVLVVNEDSLNNSGIHIMGGPRRDILITLAQYSDLDQKPKTIDVQGFVNPEYAEGVGNLFTTIEKLVPNSIWKKIKN